MSSPSIIAGVSLLTGCSLVYGDALDRRQCEVDADCASDAALGLSCIERVCQLAQCPPACGQDSSCVGGACVPDTPAVRTCSQDSECGEGERCGYDRICYQKWGCLDKPADWPTSASSFHFRTVLRRVDNNAGMDAASVGDVDAVACVAEDPLCASPIVSGDQVSLDANKQLDVAFTNVGSAGFVGTLKLQPREPGAYLPTYLHAPPATPWRADYATANFTLFTNNATTDLLQQFVGVELDPAGVLVGFALYDCGGLPAAGVRVSPTNTPSAPFIPLAAGNVPLVGQAATTEEGIGFILGLPANRLEVFVLRDEATQRVLAPSITFIVQGGGLNFLNFYPRYSAMQAWMNEYRRRAAN